MLWAISFLERAALWQIPQKLFIQRKTQEKKSLVSYGKPYEPQRLEAWLQFNILHLTSIGDHKGMPVQPTAGTAINRKYPRVCTHQPGVLHAACMCSAGGIFSPSSSMLLCMFILEKPLICAWNDHFLECHEAIESNFLICSFKCLFARGVMSVGKGAQPRKHRPLHIWTVGFEKHQQNNKPHEKASENSVTFKWQY